MFWRRKNKNEDNYKKIEGELWTYMSKYVALDELRHFRMVENEVELGDQSTGLTMVRIFNPRTVNSKNITVDSYESLNSHPELILYEGYYRHDDGQAIDINIGKKSVKKV